MTTSQRTTGATAVRRHGVEVLSGQAESVRRGIESDFALLDAVEGGASRTSHVWKAGEVAVVLGVSLDAAAEADLDACNDAGVAVLRRASGGGAVVVGPGTLQAAIALPHSFHASMASLDGAKRFCCENLRDALVAAGVGEELDVHCSGDLRAGERKVAGVALRRRRSVTLFHATILVDADLSLLERLLRHPQREPAYRRKRPHRDFVANLGDFDEQAFARALRESVRLRRDRA